MKSVSYSYSMAVFGIDVISSHFARHKQTYKHGWLWVTFSDSELCTAQPTNSREKIFNMKPKIKF